MWGETPERDRDGEASPSDAIASTMPKGSARWPMQRERGKCFIQVEAAVVDRMRAMRRPGEDYSAVILASCRTGVAVDHRE